MANVGLSHSQARVIDALARMGAVTQVRLAREFDISAASMSTMTARLIEAGFITRTVNPNETRSNIVELTARGEQLLSDIYAAWRDIDILIADTMGADDAAHLADLTRKLRDRLGGKTPSAQQTDDTEKESTS
ncbi:MarR family transcriptional regulator [Sedimentitalea sp.]|uniref:MarR family winged helix-turn-helix transcriptional regulator n=1 Tax=Sedimentitalea sp. TaxID=2048915 RepID=UPI0032971FF6